VFLLFKRDSILRYDICYVVGNENAEVLSQRQVCLMLNIAQ